MADLTTEFGGRRVLTPMVQFHPQQREALIDIVVQFPSNPSALLLMSLDQPAAHGGHCFFGELSFCDVDARADITRETAIRIEPRYAFIQDPAILPVVPP